MARIKRRVRKKDIVPPVFVAQDLYAGGILTEAEGGRLVLRMASGALVSTDLPARAAGEVAVLHRGIQKNEICEAFLEVGTDFTERVLIDVEEAAAARCPGTPWVLASVVPISRDTSYLPPSLEQDIPSKGRFWKATSDTSHAAQVMWCREVYLDPDNSEFRTVDGVLRYTKFDKTYYLPILPADSARSTDVATSDKFPLLRDVAGYQERVTADEETMCSLPDTRENRVLAGQEHRIWKSICGPIDTMYVLDSAEATTEYIEVFSVADPPQEVVQVDLVKADVGDAAVEERLAYGVAMVPEIPDAHGASTSASEIRTAAHDYMAKYQVIRNQHGVDVTGDVVVVESYLLPQATVFGDQELPAGTWMFAVRVNDDDLWAQVKSGERTGFSIGGAAFQEFT